MNDNKNSKWRIEYCYNEQKPNPESSNEGIPQNLDNLKMFPDGSGDPEADETKVQFRTLGLSDGQAMLARDLGEKAKTKGYTQDDDGTFTYKVEYTLKQPYPVLGAVMSFGSGTSENATYAVTDTLDIDDGSGMIKNFAKLSWIKPSNETVQA